MLFKAVSNRRGSAFILTLMALAIITAMIIEFAYAVHVSTSALHNWQVSQRLSLVAESGVRLVARVVSDNIRKHDYTYPTHFDIRLQDPFYGFEGCLLLRVEEENTRFNINTLVHPNGTLNEWAYKSFVRLLRALEIEHAVAAQIADRTADWIDPDSTPRRQGSEGASKNAYLDSIDELLFIAKISRAVYEKMLPYVTIYGDGLININGAETPVLISLSEYIDEELALRVIRYRELTPFESPTDIFRVAGFETIGIGLGGHIVVKGTAFRVVSTAEARGLRRIIKSVFEEDGNKLVISYWKEI